MIEALSSNKYAAKNICTTKKYSRFFTNKRGDAVFFLTLQFFL